MQAYRGFPMFLFVNVRSKNSVNLLCKISKNTNVLPVGICYPDVNGRWNNRETWAKKCTLWKNRIPEGIEF